MKPVEEMSIAELQASFDYWNNERADAVDEKVRLQAELAAMNAEVRSSGTYLPRPRYLKIVAKQGEAKTRMAAVELRAARACRELAPIRDRLQSQKQTVPRSALVTLQRRYAAIGADTTKDDSARLIALQIHNDLMSLTNGVA